MSWRSRGLPVLVLVEEEEEEQEGKTGVSPKKKVLELVWLTAR